MDVIRTVSETIVKSTTLNKLNTIQINAIASKSSISEILSKPEPPDTEWMSFVMIVRLSSPALPEQFPPPIEKHHSSHQQVPVTVSTAASRDNPVCVAPSALFQ